MTYNDQYDSINFNNDTLFITYIQSEYLLSEPRKLDKTDLKNNKDSLFSIGILTQNDLS